MRGLLAILLLLVPFQPVVAQERDRANEKESQTPSELAAAVAPYLDPQTVAVVHIDLGRLNISDVFKFAGVESRPGSSEEKFEKGLQRLREAGADDVFAVVSLADVPAAGPFFVVPEAEESAVCNAAEQLFGVDLQNGDNEARRPQTPVCERLKGAVFYGPAGTLDRLKGDQRKPSSEQVESLKNAFSAVENSALQVAALLSDEHRRVLREMAPRFPDELGGVSGDVLAAIQWAALGVSAPPDGKLRLVIQADDAEAAEGLQKLFAGAVRMLGEMPPVREQIPNYADVARLMTPDVQGNQLLLALTEQEEIETLRSLLMKPMGQARAEARRQACTNALKQLALAMHNFHDAYRSFPPSASYEGDKKLLSWRVYVLPFLDQEELYKQFKLDEPWDSEHNRKLIEKMPAVFSCGHPELQRSGKTTIVAPIGEKTIFSGKAGTRIQEITDGTSNTILLVAVPPENAVIWTKPDDWEVDLEKPLQELVAEGDEGFLAAFADGSVRFISRTIDPNVLQALLTRSGGEVVGEIP